MARNSQEEQKRRRRGRLVKGLLLGGAAIGIPALANALIAKRNRRLQAPAWGAPQRYSWEHGDIAYQHLRTGKDSAPPILLIHSLGPGHDGEEWRGAAEFLAQEHEVFVVDLLGWGRSEKPEEATYDAELYIQLIKDFLSDVVDRRSIVVAAGLTAAYATQAAIDEPQSVASLCLVVPSGINEEGDDPDIKDALVHWLLRTPVFGTSALNLYTSQTALGQYLRREVFSAPERADAGRIDHLYRSSHQPGAHAALAAYLSGYSNHTVVDSLGRLTMPLWLAWGRGAKTPAIETADLWLQRAPQAQLHVFEESGNLPHLEEPAHFANVFSQHLERLAESTVPFN